MNQRRKIFLSLDALCTGCLMCELVCSLVKSGHITRHSARIKVAKDSQEATHHTVHCRHCGRPVCMEACPVPEAMFLDQRTGAAVIRESNCIRCLACVQACPFGAIPVAADGLPLKCDLCGGSPECVRHCPTRPSYSLPHLPLPEMSCLQYVDYNRANDTTLILRQNQR